MYWQMQAIAVGRIMHTLKIKALHLIFRHTELSKEVPKGLNILKKVTTGYARKEKR